MRGIMAKLKLSYDHPEELRAVTLRLGDLVASVKPATRPTKEGGHIAYIRLKPLICKGKNGIMEQAKVPRQD